MNLLIEDTIVALATAPGIGAIAVIRLSGKEAISITNEVFKGKDLEKQASHTIHFGTIRDGETIVDEVLVSLFVGPNSFTKENVVEISSHGSPYIVQQIIRLLIKKGARAASAGEFTKRAFMNGQFDLAQAEAVADLIASESAAQSQAAISQLRGGISNEIKDLRQKLVHFASMVELELDFGEEDVEFADRNDLKDLIKELQSVIQPLMASFQYGNAVKNGIPTVIAGLPNAGKSTLLNALLKEEKAIVSNIAGTTRDVIEDQLIIEGHLFRFIDTAGLRDTTDEIEAIGVERTKQKLEQASLILYLIDLQSNKIDSVQQELKDYLIEETPLILIGNKVDTISEEALTEWKQHFPILPLSAKNKDGLDDLTKELVNKVRGEVKPDQTLVTNTRHYESLYKTNESLEKVLYGLDRNVTGDFLAMDIRQSLHCLGEITGEITTDDLLENIFSKFCIGK